MCAPSFLACAHLSDAHCAQLTGNIAVNSPTPSEPETSPPPPSRDLYIINHPFKWPGSTLRGAIRLGLMLFAQYTIRQDTQWSVTGTMAPYLPTTSPPHSTQPICAFVTFLTALPTHPRFFRIKENSGEWSVKLLQTNQPIDLSTVTPSLSNHPSSGVNQFIQSTLLSRPPIIRHSSTRLIFCLFETTD